MAKQSSFGNMLIVLTVITVAVGALLGYIHGITAEPIDLAKKQKQEAAVKDVTPEFDNSPIDDQYTVTVNGMELKVFPAMKEGKKVGAAVESKTKTGFGGEITVMVGFEADGTIRNYRVLNHAETPGLGSKMEEWFRSEKGDQSVLGKNPATDNLTVKKDGGSVDAITAATISSRAFLDVIANAYTAYTKNDCCATTGATVQKENCCAADAAQECACCCAEQEGKEACHE